MNAMLPLLYDRRLVGAREMHRYHCECELCWLHDLGDRDPFALRAQTDSTCNGEIISRIYEHIDDALPVFEALQDAAVEADAIPGYNAGFHVHVSDDHLYEGDSYDDGVRSDRRPDLLWQWLRWEPTMSQIAAGAFRAMRSFNPGMRQRLSWYIANDAVMVNSPIFRQDYESPARFLQWAEQNLDDHAMRDFRRRMYSTSREVDRHTGLATYTRFDTLEFRLWNSTRSAWRMEMFARLSLLWSDPRFFDLLATTQRVANQNDNVRTLILCAAQVDTRAAELVERQLDYMVANADQPDPVLMAA